MESEQCVCESGTLAVLGDVQRAYEDRLELITRTAGSDKLQKQVQLFRSWVNDLVAQNSLLARTVEDLEIELTSRVLNERRKLNDVVSTLRAEAAALRRRLARKDSDLRGLLELLRRMREFDRCAIDSIHFNEVTESDIFGPIAWNPNMDHGDSEKSKLTISYFVKQLQNKKICDENCLKIKQENVKERLSKGVQHYEQTNLGLKNDVSLSKYHTPDVSKRDVSVTADICCAGTKECGDVEPVKEYGTRLLNEDQYQECIQQMETLQRSGDSVRALRAANVSLSEQVRGLHSLCAALEEQCRVTARQEQLKDYIIREMRRQLIQAKTKLKDISSTRISQSEERESRSPRAPSYESLCVRQQPRRKARPSALDIDSNVGVLTSTPNTSHRQDRVVDSDISVVERSTSPPLLITDDSISDVGTGTMRSLAQVIATRASYPSRIHFDPRKNPECGQREYSTLKGSVSGRSGAESADEAERTRCLQDKLHATLQILKNKEETVKVQAESLALAEERISSLSSKLPTNTSHRGTLSQPIMRNTMNGCKLEMTDVSIEAQPQETDDKIVKTLRSNLSVIEKLYRECFYETAKQEQLIQMLRQSYLDVRVMEQQKTEQIGHLQCVVDTQRSSLQTYQEIAAEVENLKAEITSFLSNSNNDSGMWERGDETPVSDDLNHIVSQLHRLKEMLTGECTCGLEEENKKLKRKNEINESKIIELQQRVIDLEEALEDKENLDQRYARQIQEKELELNRIRQQISALERGSKEDCCCERMSTHLKQVEGLLETKTAELALAQKKCDQQEMTIQDLKDELLAQENKPGVEQVGELSQQVCELGSQLGASRRRLRSLAADLQRCRHAAAHYREKTKSAYELQSQLEEAHSRGAALCDQVRHVLCGVKGALRRQRQREKEQEEKIRQQDTLIRTLQSSQTESQLNEPCCSKSIDVRYARSASERFSGASEMGSCSSPPTPPRRFRKKSRGDSSCSCSVQRASVSQRRGADARPAAECDTDCRIRCLRETSPIEALLERVEHMHEALAAAHARWARRARAPAPRLCCD